MTDLVQADPSKLYCPKCGKELTPKQARRGKTYCSRACANRAHHLHPLVRLARRLRIEGDCLVVQGKLRPDGYGAIGVEGRTRLAHVYLYEQAIGPVPEGLELDHKCRNRACVNVAHLEPVTHQENIRRGVRFWEKCPHGDAHRYARNRTCTVCAAARAKARREEKRSAA